MADIFVSYARHDKALVATIVAALESEGWSVWWDPEIVPGQQFDDRIAEEIDRAGAVVVVWTPNSVGSRWVRGEAREAADRGILVPVRFESARLPIDARAVHTIDLDDWKEDRQSPSFKSLARALGALVARARKSSEAALSDHGESAVSIAVLPFTNMSDDRDQEYFSDGISEDIITDLSKVSALTVTSRNSAFSFKGKHVEIKQVARQLGVRHVLEGSVRKSGNRVRINAQLIDATHDSHLWAERYDRNLDDIFALQDEISQAIVSALKVKLFPAEKRAIEFRGTSNVEAYDAYLRAQASFNAQSLAEMDRTIDMYRKTVKLDPSFAQGWAGLSAALGAYFIFRPEAIASLAPEMEMALARAEELAPDLPEVHSSRGMQALTRYDWTKASELLASGFASRPDSIGIAGLLLATLGRVRESLEARLKSRRADPLSIRASFSLQLALDTLGRFEDAEREYERSKDLAGDRAALEWRAVARMMALRDARLKQRLEFFISVDAPERPYQPFLPRLLSVLEEPEAALRIVRAAFDDPVCQDAARMGAIAHWAAYFGDKGLALEALRRGYVEHRGLTLVEIWHPIFAEVRADARFKALVRDLGLYDIWRSSGEWGDFARAKGENDFEMVT